MKSGFTKRFLAGAMSVLLAVYPVIAGAEDIDIFVGSSAGAKKNPKVLFLLDNSSNWSRMAQKWPGGLTQGESEARSVKKVVSEAGSDVSMGLMEYATAGGGDSGGYVRHAVSPMDSANQTALMGKLQTIFDNINDPNEKINSSKGYGDLMYSVYQYFNGAATVAPSSSVVASLADSNGYTSNYTRFKSPLSDDNSCGRNFLIFIANNVQGAVDGDTSANGTALNNLGGKTSPQLPYQQYQANTITATTDLGFTNQCFSSQATCNTADFAADCGAGGAYTSCVCANISTTALAACPAGTQRWSISGQTASTMPVVVGPTAGTPYTMTSNTTSCYVSQATAAAAVTAGTDRGGLTCPAATSVTAGNVTTTTSYSCTFATSATASSSCPNTPTTRTGTSASCYNGVGTGGSNWNPAVPTETGTIGACPAGNTCTYTGVLGTGTGCTGMKKKIDITETATPSGSRGKYGITMTVTPSVTTTTIVAGTVTSTLLGDTAACFATAGEAVANSAFAPTCATYNAGCSAGAPSPNAGKCSSGSRFLVQGQYQTTNYVPIAGTSITPTDGANGDEWADFMQRATAINSQSGTDMIKQSITTYVIDVFNAQQDANRSALLRNMALYGGGNYYTANNEQQILDALRDILAQIQSINTTFASASLPVNATNRTQNANQVFIGMFRPDPNADPRWFGNLKQYAVGRVNGTLDLVDVAGRAATNPLTGFVDDCAQSFWTTDSGKYWATLKIPVNPDPASNCKSTTFDRYSDAPDGPTVEKGGAAEVLRRGNDPSNPSPTNDVNRTLYTGTSSLVAFTAASSGLSDTSTNNVFGYSEGKDVNDDTGSGGASTKTARPSIHGDVVHSRPLPINYGDKGVTVYYGGNDGFFRAVEATEKGTLGKEKWAYFAPEFKDRMQRLMLNDPKIAYPSLVEKGIPSLPKDYFFDGSIGIFQNKDNSKVWIYPTQRRGGRMLYAFDVTDPTAPPTLKWRNGCPALDSDTGCTTSGSSFSEIGQTWSTPNVAFIKGYSTTAPIAIVGGGYDPCEDEDNITKSCGSAKGRVIYIIDADTGEIIKSFTTLRSVAADVSFIDVNNDGFVDYAFVGDTGGNLYRIDFISNPLAPTTLDKDAWKFRRVAYTNGAGRKFLFTPGLFASASNTYVAITSGDRERPLIGNYPYKSPVVNRAYVYKDDLNATSGAVNLDGSDMLDFTDPKDSTCTSKGLLDAENASKKGWYMDLTAGRGEQGVTSAVIVAGMVTFSTNRPLEPNAASCGAALGEARGYFVNLFNASGTINTTNNASCGGARSNTFAGGGLPPSPVIGVVPVDGVPTAILIGAVQRGPGANSPIKPSQVVPPISQLRQRTYKSINSDK